MTAAKQQMTDDDVFCTLFVTELALHDFSTLFQLLGLSSDCF